ncbi:MAG: hypothetical protein MK135_03685 [Polyangiaceae bacterium]|nr:hypothetical protein [Polyangiaceae bacterium]
MKAQAQVTILLTTVGELDALRSGLSEQALVVLLTELEVILPELMDLPALLARPLAILHLEGAVGDREAFPVSGLVFVLQPAKAVLALLGGRAVESPTRSKMQRAILGEQLDGGALFFQHNALLGGRHQVERQGRVPQALVGALGGKRGRATTGARQQWRAQGEKRCGQKKGGARGEVFHEGGAWGHHRSTVTKSVPSGALGGQLRPEQRSGTALPVSQGISLG